MFQKYLVKKRRSIMASFHATARDGRSLEDIRQDFPMLRQNMNGHPLIYFNSGATSLTPESVLDAMQAYYRNYGVNVARGVDFIGYEATSKYEGVRAQVARFLGAKQSEEIIFTRGTTEALNLVCYSYGEDNIEPGDEIIVSAIEHHANYVPWQQLAKRKQAKLVVVEPDANGIITPDILVGKLTERTKIVALFHISNVMGGTNDLTALAKAAHKVGAIIVIDGAQGVIHEEVDVLEADVDFYAFSGHKLLGPTGIGVLYGKLELLNKMRPWQYGGEMIDVVDIYDSSFAESPERFEAGTMPIAEVIGLGAAIDYIEHIGYSFIQQQIERLGKAMVEGLGLQSDKIIYNPHNYANGVVCYNVQGIHPHDAAGVYDREGISIRAGHHCNQPTMRFLDVQSTLRASVNFYNSMEEVEHFLEISKKAGDFLDVLF